MNQINKERIYQGIVPLLFILSVTILSWPSLQKLLGPNGVLISLCTFFPILSLQTITPKNLKGLILQIIIITSLYLIFSFGLRSVNWNKSHFLILHGIVLSITLFLKFSYFNRTQVLATNILKNISLPIIPLLSLILFSFWYLKSINLISFNFSTLWFFASFLALILFLYLKTDNLLDQKEYSQSKLMKSILFHLSGCLFFVTITWVIINYSNISSPLFWPISLFLILSIVANGVNEQYRQTKSGRIYSVLFILLALFQTCLSIFMIVKHGPLESRFVHLMIALIASFNFALNFITVKDSKNFKLIFVNIILGLSFVGPINIYKVSLNGQKRNLWAIFENNKMIENNKVTRPKSELSNNDRLEISSIFHYIYHNHDIKSLSSWFTFDLNRIFKNATPFIVEADFDQDLANLKAILNNLGLNYTPRNLQNKKNNVKRITFYLTRLSDGSNSVDVSGYNNVIKDYTRPMSITTTINKKSVKFHFNKSDNILEATIDGKLVYRINILEKYRPFIVIDKKKRHMNLDIHAKDLDIEFNTNLFSVKFVINRIQGQYENDKMVINNIESLCLIKY